tara:strand:+ start:263 stop:904 length:642 start_codon:yes stop_codon:yes gene_type:complete
MTKIIIALDNTSAKANVEIASKLKNKVDGFKVNHLMWEYTDAIRDLADELFIDCKLWDTPNTISQVMKRIVGKGATMTTISTLNNSAVFEELQDFRNKIKLLGVTYLTSWTGEDLLSIVHQNAPLLWRENIDRVRPYGFAGMICSPKDLQTVNPLAPHMIKVCPGIGTNSGQSRTTTPQQAKELGADYLVIGRTVTESNDPVQTVLDIKENLQ